MRNTLTLASLFAVLSVSATAQTITAAPATMNFQGRLARPDGTPVADGTHTLTFRIYDTQLNGTVRWAEQIGSVVTRNGVFSALLGKVFPFSDTVLNGNPYLEIQVDNETPLLPRQQFQSVAFALKANTVPDNAITTAKIADAAITAAKIADAAITALKLAPGVNGFPSGYKILGDTMTAPSGFTFNGESIANATWVTQNPPLGKASRAAVTVNNKIYFVSGNNGSGVVSTVSIYDPTTGIWTSGTPIPSGRQNAAVAVVNGKIHLVGGIGSDNVTHTDHYVYDPATDSWTTKATLPIALNAASAIGYGNFLYAIGGNSGTTNYVYDDMNNTWTVKAPMFTGRSLFGVALVGQTIYAFGGTNGSSSALATNEAYDIATNTWSVKTSMITPRQDHMVAVIDGKIYSIGGTQNPGGATSALSTNEMYDPALNVWQTRPTMITARYAAGVTTVNGDIYIIGGRNGSTFFTVNEVYTPGRVYYVFQKQ